jgi:hypothetical protein
MTLIVVASCVIVFKIFLKTKFGRRVFDKLKLKMPALGPVISKLAISGANSIAASSKGKMISSRNELKELLKKDDKAEEVHDELSPQNWQSVWDKAWLLLVVIFAAASDYYLRRRNGLL